MRNSKLSKSIEYEGFYDYQNGKDSVAKKSRMTMKNNFITDEQR